MGRTDSQLIHWGHGRLSLVIDVSPKSPPSLVRLAPQDVHDAAMQSYPSHHQPLTEILIAGEGHTWSGTRSIGSAVGRRLRYTSHEEVDDGEWRRLHVHLADQESGLKVEIQFRTIDGLPAFQTYTQVTNQSSSPVVLHGLSSFTASSFLPPAADLGDVDVTWARSDWLAESRWRTEPVREAGLADLDMELHRHRSRGCFAVIGSGSWSTNGALPTGMLRHRPSGQAWAWQIEHNGAWRWEIGESIDGIYVSTSGPTDSDHQWRHVLDPGGSFTSVPVGVAVADTGLDGIAAALTAYRRRIVREHPDRRALPVVFNDYMNTLMGNPTNEALEPLIDAAGDAGAEYFCIDAGWHDDTLGADWARAMGAWEPSTTRFAKGLSALIERIRSVGMVPGLWLEPEAVGLASPIVHQLPDEAFFQRSGHRQIEDGRYHLDLRHPAVVEHLDGTIDRLVADFGIGYFKFDYNVDAGPGTDVKSAAPGDGLLGHNRALLAWLDGLLDRHPGLVIENCGSGALRMDYAMLSRLQLQSTSDQQNPVLYPPIAGAAPMSVLPEQAANWAYPQPDMSAEEIAFCLVTGMAGRLYLSGHLDKMRPEQRRLVADGVAASKAIRHEIAQSVPFWPLGLPGWTDNWVSLGFRPAAGYDAGPAYLAIWRRAGASPELRCEIRHLTGQDLQPEIVYPATLTSWDFSWGSGTGVLSVNAHEPAPAARLIRLI